MNKQINIQGKSVNINLTNAAEKALSLRKNTLLAEMELYFSCLIRKQVRFNEIETDDSVNVTDNFSVHFRPVMTKSCGIDYEGDEPPLEDFPIEKPKAFIPHWLKIDYKKDKWIGEFGY